MTITDTPAATAPPPTLIQKLAAEACRHRRARLHRLRRRRRRRR
ncbi:hypothetical protein [Nocardioides sp. TF02-7]|nr:hypothetical protein [Nocardioides sp. TF02-7]